MSEDRIRNSQRFLTSVLYVDDFEEKDLATDDDASIEDDRRAEGVQPAADPTTRTEDNGSPRELDLARPPSPIDQPQLVTEAFARAKLLCTVLDPGFHVPAEIQERRYLVLGAARRADIVVLDWKLHPDEEPSGGFAIEILKHLVEERPSALQMVCIYTADPDLARIKTEVSAAFPDASEIDELHLRIRSLNVVILSKAEYQLGSSAAPDTSTSAATFGELPDRLIDEFSQATDGLAPQFAIAALGAIRDSSWSLTSTFSDDIDRGLITHFACLDETTDGLRHLAEAFTDELGFIVSEDEHVAASLAADRILEMSRQYRLDDEEIATTSAPDGLNSTALDTYFDRGGTVPNKAHTWLTELHTPSGSKPFALQYDLLFAHLLQSRRRYGESPPSLTLGTIVRKLGTDTSDSVPTDESVDATERQWMPGDVAVCVMPLCDTDRLKDEPRRFFFAPMEITEDRSFSKGKSHVAISVDNRQRLASVSVKLFDLVFADFAPEFEQPRILAIRTDDAGASWRFSDEETDQFELLGELRPIFRQRLVDALAADAGRIGADLPEWIRRSERPK